MQKNLWGKLLSLENKPLERLGWEGTCLSAWKTWDEKPRANVIIHREKLEKKILLKSGKRKDCSPFLLFFNITFKVPAEAINASEGN